MAVSTRWPMFNQGLHRQGLMDEMMERLGVDVLIAVRAQAFVRARARCRDCLRESECQKWLDSSPILPLPPDFLSQRQFLSARVVYSESTVCGGSIGLADDGRAAGRFVAISRSELCGDHRGGGQRVDCRP